MSQLQTNVSDIKTVAKNLARELKTMKFDISHSSALNLASRSLGYNNYQTYKAFLDKENSLKTYKELSEEVAQDKIKNYPSIDDKFIKFGHSETYDLFLYSDNEEEYLPRPYLLFRLSNSYTERIYYSPKYETFFLFIAPTLKKPNYAYPIKIKDIETKHLYSLFLHKIQHINRKGWANSHILNDLMQLMLEVKEDREWLKETAEEHSKEKLDKLWSKKNNNF